MIDVVKRTSLSEVQGKSFFVVGENEIYEVIFDGVVEDNVDITTQDGVRIVSNSLGVDIVGAYRILMVFGNATVEHTENGVRIQGGYVVIK